MKAHVAKKEKKSLIQPCWINIASEAIYVFILSGQKLLKNATNNVEVHINSIWRIFFLYQFSNLVKEDRVKLEHVQFWDEMEMGERKSFPLKNRTKL